MTTRRASSTSAMRYASRGIISRGDEAGRRGENSCWRNYQQSILMTSCCDKPPRPVYRNPKHRDDEMGDDKVLAETEDKVVVDEVVDEVGDEMGDEAVGEIFDVMGGGTGDKMGYEVVDKFVDESASDCVGDGDSVMRSWESIENARGSEPQGQDRVGFANEPSTKFPMSRIASASGLAVCALLERVVSECA